LAKVSETQTDITELPGSPQTPRRGGGARHVYEVLRDEILELKMPPGAALDETSLATRFSLSRSPIREALVRLAADGLVRTLSNRSTIVAPLDIALLPRYVEALDYLQRVVTRLAARHRTEADLAAMEAAARTYDETCARGDYLQMSGANKAFHMTVAEAGQNPYFADAYRRLLDEGRRILHMHYARRRDSDDPYPLSPEHFHMVAAIRDRDEAAADRLAHEHTRVFHDRLIEFMRVAYVEEI